MSRIAARNMWFQVHKWIGLILAIAIIPICFTGAALVWDEPLDRLLNPVRHEGGRPALAPAVYADAARAALAPGERLAELRYPEDGEGPVVASAARPPVAGQGGRPVRTMIWLDPETAAVVDRAASNAGAIRVMHVIHGSLMIPGVGRPIVGWIGVAMLLSCISGLWLWWPTVGSWVRGLRWKRHRNFDTNLHHLFGFWIVLPLAVLSFTGVWISFPGVFNTAQSANGGAPRDESARPAGGQEGQGGRAAAPDPRAMMRARPLADPVRDPAAVMADAGISADQIASITWPSDMQPAWTLAVKGTGERPDQVRVDDASGAIERVARRGGPERESTSRLMRRIHDGNGTGIVWQTIVFLGGALPTVLGITGIIMWWRARKWRRDLASRKRRPRIQPAE